MELFYPFDRVDSQALLSKPDLWGRRQHPLVPTPCKEPTWALVPRPGKSLCAWHWTVIGGKGGFGSHTLKLRPMQSSQSSKYPFFWLEKKNKNPTKFWIMATPSGALNHQASYPPATTEPWCKRSCSEAPLSSGDLGAVSGWLSFQYLLPAWDFL